MRGPKCAIFFHLPLHLKKSSGWDKWTRKSRDEGNDEEDVEDCFLSPFPVDLGSRFLITFLRDPSIRTYVRALLRHIFFLPETKKMERDQLSEKRGGSSVGTEK